MITCMALDRLLFGTCRERFPKKEMVGKAPAFRHPSTTPAIQNFNLSIYWDGRAYSDLFEQGGRAFMIALLMPSLSSIWFSSAMKRTSWLRHSQMISEKRRDSKALPI
jgi:hypothetical protein